MYIYSYPEKTRRKAEKWQLWAHFVGLHSWKKTPTARFSLMGRKKTIISGCLSKKEENFQDGGVWRSQRGAHSCSL
jgi:hypothetical protein